MSEIHSTTDSIERRFCREHHREICHDCYLEYDNLNRLVEEEQGLIRKATEVERAAQRYANAKQVEIFEAAQRYELAQEVAVLERFRSDEEVLNWACNEIKGAEDTLRGFARGNDVELAKRATQELDNNLMTQRAFMQARAIYPPSQAESREAHKRRVYWSLASPPPIDSDRADRYTCAYCRKVSTELTCCGRCKKSWYCSKACQKVCFKVHKKVCIATDKAAKSLPLTWAQLEAHGGQPVEGETLQVRAIVDVSTMRQVYICKDRVGDVMQVAAYTNSRKLHPDLKQGSIIKWKNPRFYCFNDPSTGARIEEEDLVNIIVTNDL